MMTNTKKLNLGSVQVHEKVVAEIITTAITDIDGVSLSKKTLGSKLVRFFNKGYFPGIIIQIGDGGEVSVELGIYIRYGLNMQMIAKEVQSVIRKAIEKAMEIEVKEINVNIIGIERG